MTLALLAEGPVISAHIGVAGPRRDALIKAGQPVPTLIPCRLLVDTGASSTCVDSTILQQLQLSPSGVIDVHTPSTTAGNAHQCFQYDVSLAIAQTGWHWNIQATPVLESHLAHQGIDGLLGRDILAYCLLFYNGQGGFFTLGF
ncbi:MAG: aspartyl protease family protein [Candidatus Competibacter sp.]